jgi:hypothetical protein
VQKADLEPSLNNSVPIFKMVWYVLLRPLRPELDGQVGLVVVATTSCRDNKVKMIRPQCQRKQAIPNKG